MNLGKLYLRVAWSMWRDWRFHRIDGRGFVPLLQRLEGDTAVFGRGGVISVAGVMLWWLRETHRAKIQG